MKRRVEKYDYQCLNDAKAILVEIDMPERYYNPRCVMAFAAFAEMKSGDSKWRNASENYHGTHFLLDFINENFPCKAGLDSDGYSENSRETFRKDTIKPFISAGILEAKPGLATNDKDNSYRFTSHFAQLIRTYGTDRWEETLGDYKATHNSYSEYLKQAKQIERLYDVNYKGIDIQLDKSGHNKLQVDILNLLLPLVSPDVLPELLYIGDTSNRTLYKQDSRMEELGIEVMKDSASLPDVIAYDNVNNRVIFVEAYYSGGAFTIDRVKKLKSLCDCADNTTVAFITAFDKTSKMLKAYKNIAWDTEIWTADEPTHLLHKNGDKFIGRPLKE